MTQTILEACMAEEHIKYNKGITYEEALKYVKSQNISSKTRTSWLYTFNGQAKVLETAKRLDWEQNPSYPVLFSIPEAEFAIEAKFYLLTEAIIPSFEDDD